MAHRTNPLSDALNSLNRRLISIELRSDLSADQMMRMQFASARMGETAAFMESVVRYGLMDTISFPYERERPSFSPIDGHHPSLPEQRVYPELGRKILAEDLGQPLVRVYPYRYLNNNYDWSNIPFDSTKKKIQKEACIFTNNYDGTYTKISDPFKKIYSYSSSVTKEEFDLENDGNWTTVKELECFLKIKKQGLFAYAQKLQYPRFKKDPSLYS